MKIICDRPFLKEELEWVNWAGNFTRGVSGECVLPCVGSAVRRLYDREKVFFWHFTCKSPCSWCRWLFFFWGGRGDTLAHVFFIVFIGGERSSTRPLGSTPLQLLIFYSVLCAKNYSI